MNRIENERQNHETERKRREEEFNEREERYEREMKEKERETHEEIKREREELEKQKLEQKRRREEEDKKRREKEQRDWDEFNQRLKEEREKMKTEKEDFQSKHKEEENKMKSLMEKLKREREELMKKHEEEKERMKMMMEEERQNQDKERKTREEEFREREERYKRLIKDREEKERKMLEQMEQERMQWEKQKQDEGQKREEKKKKEEETERQESELHKKQQSEVSYLTSGLNLVLLGIGGAGKSASGNSILGRPAFLSRTSHTSVTRDVAVESGTVDGFPVTVYDTPGLLNTYMSEDEIQQKFKRVLQKCESGSCAFLLVIKPDRFTDEERKTVEKIERLLGENRLKKTWILFTGGDDLEDGNMTIKEYLNETEPLKKLVQKYDQRYHVFNNKMRGASDQARLLLIKILQSSLGLKDGGRLRQIHVRRNTHNEQQTGVSLSSRRIVLLGKTGVGKSASGNTILGQRVFRSELNVHSVTRECSEGHATVSGRSVSVVDTPFFDTRMNPEELMIEIVRSVYLSCPGPHAFLIVFPVNMRFTEQELQIPQMTEILFGQEVFKYSIILFTHGDLLEGKSVKELIEENSRLRHLVDQCGGRFHVFNNRDESNREQVNDLLQKIDMMIEQNRGGYYSNQMFEDALRFRLEEEERRLREEEDRQREERRWREENQRKQQQKQS